MVKIVKSKPAFPNGVAGMPMKFPMWNAVETIDQNQLKGLYRGDFLFFRYKSKEEKYKKVNSNPLIIFEGVDQNGNIVGTNLMFFNKFIDPKTGKKEVNTRYIIPVIETMREKHWNNVYIDGKRTPYLPFMKSNFGNLFGRNVGLQMNRFWRAYKTDKIVNVSNITIDMALQILSTTDPTYIKTTKSIK